MKTKILVAVFVFVSSVSIARSQAQNESVRPSQVQPQALLTAPADTQSSEALHTTITKPEVQLQKSLDQLPEYSSHESPYDCRPYKRHLLNIHFDDRPFDTKCKGALTPNILPYEYGPSRKQFWGTFAVAASSMVVGTEMYERYSATPRSRGLAYSVGVTGLSTIIVYSLPRLRPDNEQNPYKFLAMGYAAFYAGLATFTLVTRKH